MSDQPEALRLADALVVRVIPRWIHSPGETPRLSGFKEDAECVQAAAELHRLHAKCNALQQIVADYPLIEAELREVSDRAFQAESACDALRERSKLYEQLREVIDNGSESMTHEDAVEELTRLRAEVDALRADAERLDWLTRMIPGNALRRIGVEWPAWSPENARAAIDAARAALKEKTNG